MCRPWLNIYNNMSNNKDSSSSSSSSNNTLIVHDHALISSNQLTMDKFMHNAEALKMSY